MSVGDPGIHEGDIGTRLIVTITDRKTGQPIDLTGYTTLRLRMTDPQGSVVYHDMQPLMDGADGKVYFQSTLATEFSPAGTWKAYVNVVIPGWGGHSSPFTFVVHPIG